MNIPDQILKTYDIRGIYPDQLNESIAENIGQATTFYLQRKKKSKKITILVCRDIRNSSLPLTYSLIMGILKQGADVLDGGQSTTPYFNFLMQKLKPDGGIMVTASHNPPQYNGFKIRDAKFHPIGAASGLKDIQRISQEIKGKSSIPSGKIIPVPREFFIRYINFISKTKKIGSIKAVIDASGGATTLFLPEVLSRFERLLYKPLFFEPDGVFRKHNPNPLLSESQQYVKREIAKGGFDFGAIFDGDGDRVIFLDEKGTMVRPEIILALLAKQIIKNKKIKPAFVLPINSSRSAREYISKNGGKVVLSRVGYVFVIEAMRKHKAELGAESSGHFYFKNFFYEDSGVMAFLSLAQFLSRASAKLSKLVNQLTSGYFISEEINLQIRNSQEALLRVENFYQLRNAQISRLDGITIEFPEWWFNLRPSNTEPVVRLTVEARDKDILEEKIREIRTLVETR